MEVTGCDEFSLRNAIAASLSGDPVVFTQDCHITLSGPILLNRSVDIDGGGNTVVIQGAANVRIFDINGSAHVTLNGLTLTGGQTNLGGAIYVHSPSSALVMTSCTLSGNNAIGADGLNGTDGTTGGNIGGNGTDGAPGLPGRGGAIYNLGNLFMYNCLVVSNTTGGGNGGNGGSGGAGFANSGSGGNGASAASGAGGGVYNGGVLGVGNCLFAGNTAFGGNAGAGGAVGTNGLGGLPGTGGAGGAGMGAGIYSATGSLIRFITNSTFSDNSAESGASAAGGMFPNGNGIAGADGPNSLGGGLYLGVTGYVANCTFFLNNCFGGNGGNGGNGQHGAGNGGKGGDAIGGGMYAGAGATVASCTFSNCNAIGGTNGVVGSGVGGLNGTNGLSLGGDIAQGGGTFKLKYTILATNSSGGAFFGVIADNGYNIYFGTNKLINVNSFSNNNVMLGPLTDNGGSDVGAPGSDLTLTTMRLTNGSPAMNKIPISLAISNQNNFIAFPALDERGSSRTNGKAKADIGAYSSGTPLLQLTNYITTVDAPLTVTVIASGDGPFSYQWKSNGVPLVGETSPSLTIPDVSADIGTNVQVVVTNLFGRSTATLKVNFAPEITFQPVSQTAQPGGPATLSVTNTGQTPMTNAWFFKATNANTFSLLTTSTNKTGLTNLSSSITITNVQTNNLGNYFVVLLNAYGIVTSSVASVSFGASPIITRPPVNATNNVGENAIFSVTASGDPTPAYQWQFRSSTSSLTNIPNANSTALALLNVQPSDAGSYTVIVSNSVAVITSSPPAVLTVISRSGPNNIRGPDSQTVRVNSDAVFNILADGTTPMSFTWYFNGSQLAGASGSSLHLTGVQASDAGSYYAFINNGVGASVRSPVALLTVVTQLNPLVLVPSRSGFSFSNQQNLAYIVDYSTNLPPTNWTPLSTNLGNGTVLTISNSVPYPTHFYRVHVQ